MFTVKTISKHGNEAIYEAVAVSYFGGTSDSGETGGPRHVSATLKSEFTVTLASGEVFVMNDAGKTVAAYRFD